METKWKRLASFIVVFLIATICWAIVAESILQIERKYWIWPPIYLLLVVVYWVPAWGAVASQLKELPNRRSRIYRGTGCLFMAMVVFLVLCALLAIVFM